MVKRSLLVACFCVTATAPLWAASQLTLKNGMVFEGDYGQIGALAENPLVRNATAGGVATRPIVIVDDQLRRTYFPYRQLAFAPTETGTDDTPLRIRQRVASSSPRVGAVGALLDATPFDEYGRRTVTVMTYDGPRQIVQGITEISPVYTRVRGLQGENSVDWDMRIATSSIPSDTLRQVVLQNSEKHASDAYRDLVRLLFQSERYREAARQLQQAMQRYPELKSLESLNLQLIQRGAQRLLDEIRLRQEAGQHRYAAFLLSGFPSENVATQNLISAAEMLKEYEVAQDQGKRILTALQPLVDQVDDATRRKLVDAAHAEIKRDLNVDNLPRLADFLRLADDQGLTEDERLSLAISGWLLGQGTGLRNLAVATSLVEVRDLVREYLRAMGEENAALRQELLARIREREGGTPEYIAQLLSQMVPPLDPPEATEIEGYHEVEVPRADEAFPARYAVQLPPEYDPYRRYPAIVSLHPAGAAPEMQINWWAGVHDPKLGKRRGQATRHGYIVIAPAWTRAGQTAYEYSAREHDVVLRSLRDAMRRFSIDSDRVFLSGHALGGDAAWDIAVAHPDLWAGAILIGARADYGQDDSAQYITHYAARDSDNAKLPLYFVYGELDENKLADSSVPLNRYMKWSGHDPIVVQYQGRGNEHFYEEIHRLFRWMKPLRRQAFPDEFEVVTRRPWDNFFWYMEVNGLPPAAMVSPLGWPPQRSQPARIKGSFINNRVALRTGAETATIWFAPPMVDFAEPIEVLINAKRERADVAPDIEIMLEDARRRADRRRVFWTRMEVQTGRGGR